MRTIEVSILGLKIAYFISSIGIPGIMGTFPRTGVRQWGIGRMDGVRLDVTLGVIEV